jgi:hypothetical protein
VSLLIFLILIDGIHVCGESQKKAAKQNATKLFPASFFVVVVVVVVVVINRNAMGSIYDRVIIYRFICQCECECGCGCGCGCGCECECEYECECGWV